MLKKKLLLFIFCSKKIWIFGFFLALAEEEVKKFENFLSFTVYAKKLRINQVDAGKFQMDVVDMEEFSDARTGASPKINLS